MRWMQVYSNTYKHADDISAHVGSTLSGVINHIRKREALIYRVKSKIMESIIQQSCLEKNNGFVSIGIHFKARLKGTLRENRQTLSKPIHSAKSTNTWEHYCYLVGSLGNLYCYRKCMGHYRMKTAKLQRCRHINCLNYMSTRCFFFSTHMLG